MGGLDPAVVDRFRRAAPPAASTPWRQAEFCVVDLETTGLDAGRDEIISFASVTVAGGRVRLSDAATAIAHPQRMPTGETIRIHGLREADLAAAPPLEALLERLLDAAAGRALVAHVAAVEESFLAAALRPHGLALPEPAIDTAALAARLRALQGRRRRDGPAGLSDLARSLGLPVHRPHTADGDALTTAQAFIALAAHLEAYEPVTVGSLRGLAVPPRRRPGPLRRALRALRPSRG